MMPFALGWKVLGAERQRNGGWGSETLCFWRWSRPSTSELEPGRSSSDGEEVDLGGGQTAQAAWGAEKFPESQRGLSATLGYWPEHRKIDSGCEG